MFNYQTQSVVRFKFDWVGDYRIFIYNCSTNAGGVKLTIEIEHKIVKNPNWPEALQLAIYKHCRRSERVKSKQGPLNCDSVALIRRPRSLHESLQTITCVLLNDP